MDLANIEKDELHSFNDLIEVKGISSSADFVKFLAKCHG
jgi:hypothetical protein